MDDDCLVEVEKCIGLALQCVDQEPGIRPLATDIYNSLNQVTASGNQAHITLNENQEASLHS